MAESKEAYLNQPYYGPSVLPQTQPTPPTKTLTPYALFCTIIKITTLIIIAIGIVVLALWLIYQPQPIKVYADAASLSVFNLSGVAAGNSTATLIYNLTVGLSFRNPNRKYSIYYKRVHAQAFYAGEQIGAVGFPRLYQEKKSTLPMSVRFEGKTAVAGDRDQSTAVRIFEREKGGGFFYVSVRIYAVVRLKMIVIESVQFKPDADCYLRIPAPSNATSLAAGFVRTECDVHNFS